MEKTIGVLGGMGPQATADFFRQLIHFTPARRDQDHLRIVVNNDPKIPDRTDFLMGRGESPLPRLLARTRDLVSIGADLIAIPCNTAHCFWKEINDSVRVPVLNIVEETVARIRISQRGGPNFDKVGILATRATVQINLYQTALDASGLTPVLPEPEVQDQITQTIAWIKGRRRQEECRSHLMTACDHLREKGASALILGCTELGLVPIRNGIPSFDSLKILAESAVRRALAKTSIPCP